MYRTQIPILLKIFHHLIPLPHKKGCIPKTIRIGKNATTMIPRKLEPLQFCVCWLREVFLEPFILISLSVDCLSANIQAKLISYLSTRG